ncbi:THAP domain-containing protein 6-like [Solea solea]|uniref:THAP domain-containing protein 6-like n=1 Tax=Solea solea TaxID=90069 RepID=UPI00272D3630|nr:THAP domain-containing protein 6-like [Solea solea]
MPNSCSACGCTNRCNIQARSQGITFHKFPKDDVLRKLWEVALRREGFNASQSSRLCSEHFRQEDFDRTGQTVRIREGAVPSVFPNFPAHLQRPVETRMTLTSKKAQESTSVNSSKPIQETEPLSVPYVPNVDHFYALPTSASDLTARLNQALTRIESLEREMRNAKDRERRAKNTLHGLVEYLRQKNLLNEELKDWLDLYSGKVKRKKT